MAELTHRTIRLICTLLILAAFAQPALLLGGSDTGLLIFGWSSVKLSVSTENSSEPIATSSNSTCVAARPHVPRSTAQIVAAYGFEQINGNKTPDSSGTSHSATLINAVLTTGKFGKGLVLNGTDAYVRIDEPRWPRRDYTYAAWVYPRTVSGWRALLEMQTPESRGVELAIAPGGPVEMWSSGRLRLRNGIPLPAVAWTHVALTRAESLITVFLNGVAQRAGRDSTVLDFGNCPALIGVDADFGCTDKLNGFFSGVIDELQIYDCALSASEIRLIMDVPVDQMSN